MAELINIWSIFVISMVGIIIFTGVGATNDFLFENQRLSGDSLNLYVQFNEYFFDELNEEYIVMRDSIIDSDTNRLEVDPDVNTIDAFVKEFGEAKARVGVLRNTMRLVTMFPNMLLLSVPYLPEGIIRPFVNIIFLGLLITIGIAIFDALFRRKVV